MCFRSDLSAQKPNPLFSSTRRLILRRTPSRLLIMSHEATLCTLITCCAPSRNPAFLVNLHPLSAQQQAGHGHGDIQPVHRPHDAIRRRQLLPGVCRSLPSTAHPHCAQNATTGGSTNYSDPISCHHENQGYGFVQVLFLLGTYAYILSWASNLISDGSELLLLVPSLKGAC